MFSRIIQQRNNVRRPDGIRVNQDMSSLLADVCISGNTSVCELANIFVDVRSMLWF